MAIIIREEKVLPKWVRSIVRHYISDFSPLPGRLCRAAEANARLIERCYERKRRRRVVTAKRLTTDSICSKCIHACATVLIQTSIVSQRPRSTGTLETCSVSCINVFLWPNGTREQCRPLLRLCPRQEPYHELLECIEGIDPSLSCYLFQLLRSIVHACYPVACSE